MKPNGATLLSRNEISLLIQTRTPSSVSRTGLRPYHLGGWGRRFSLRLMLSTFILASFLSTVSFLSPSFGLSPAFSLTGILVLSERVVIPRVIGLRSLTAVTLLEFAGLIVVLVILTSFVWGNAFVLLIFIVKSLFYELQKRQSLTLRD